MSAEPESEAETRAWLKHRLDVERYQAKVLALLCATLMPAWAPFDYMLAPDRIELFWGLRLGNALVGIAVLYLLPRAKTLRAVQAGCLTVWVTTGFVIALMLPLVRDNYWQYVFGFSLCFWAGAVVFSIPFRQAAAACAAIVVFAVVVQVAQPDLRIPSELVGAAFFILTTVVIALTQVYLRRRLQRQAFMSQHRLEVANQKVLESERLKDQFFANVSHELRTPLMLITGPAERLHARAQTEEERRDLALILRNSLTLLKHVNDLLNLSRLDAGAVELAYSEVDIARLVRVTAANFDGVADERSMQYRVDCPDSLTADVDPEKLQRVVLNLLANAFKFSPAGGHIVCSVGCDRDGRGESVFLEVSDSGPGVPEEERCAIFERFRQLDGGVTRRFGGTGLGLAIAREVVELHAGTIGCSDAPGGGARFRVTLPRRAPLGITVTVSPESVMDGWLLDDVLRGTVDELLAPVQAAPLQGAPSSAPLVLVVEDNADMNQFICETLAPTYRTVRALDGAEGLAQARALLPDLIISDVMMPKMSGDALVREIRTMTELDDIPILLLTAKADDGLRGQILRNGAQDYLMKPFAADELIARVGNHVAVKRTRQVLRQELESQGRDIELLAFELTAKTRQLQTALAYTEVAREQAEHASQLKSSFLGLVSHELRTPLTALQLQLELVQQGQLGPRETMIVGRMAGRLARLNELIESLLQYSRMQTGHLRAEVTPVELDVLARECLDEVRPQADDKQIKLELTLEDSLPVMRSDRTLLRLVIVNLMANAVKFTEVGQVSLGIRRSGPFVRIEVKDTGPGIPKEAQQRIFEPFEQLEPISRKHLAGIGLGLALVRELTTALGGTIDVESQPGQGSTFVVELPVHRNSSLESRTLLNRSAH